MVKDLNIIHDTIKFLEENIGKTFSDINCTNVFLSQSSKTKGIKAKIYKRDLIKFISFCRAKESINKTKRNLQNGRKYFPTKQLTRDQSPKYTNSSCSSISKKQTTQSKKMGGRPKQTFLQRRHTGGQETHEKMLNITTLKKRKSKLQ